MGFHRHFGLPKGDRNQTDKRTLSPVLVFGVTFVAVIAAFYVIVTKF
jgi:hypothetical protein